MTSGVSQTKAEATVMNETAANFEGVNDSLQSMLRNLMSQLDVLQSAWVGRGGQSFTGVKNQWAENQAKMSQALAQTAADIRTSGVNYDATDTEASSRMAATNPGIQLPL